MDDPITAEATARIRQSFLLGLARQPLAVPHTLQPLIDRIGPEREPALALLALVGQRQRFVGKAVPPVDPPSDIARQMHADPRPILPEAARRALKHLGGSVDKSYQALIVSLAVRRVAEAGYRLHPFDLPDLARHIKDDAPSLGIAERAYLALVAGDGEDGSAQTRFFDRITLENWTTFPKGHRKQFVAGLRKDDPAAGRALVEGVWKTEPAPVRLALLEGLATGLGPDDMPFLEALTRDRAETVKQLASRLIADMPDSTAFADRLAAAAACFTRSPQSLAGRMLATFGAGKSKEGAFIFQFPADPDGKGQHTAEQFARRQRMFSGIPLSALAQSVGGTAEAVLDSLRDDHVVSLLANTALEAGDTATVCRIVRHRLTAAETIAPFMMMAVVAQARVTLAPDQAASVLASPAWPKAIATVREEAAGRTTPPSGGLLVHAATLMPHPAMPAFLASIADLPPATTRAARDFADLVLTLGAATPSSQS